MAEKAIRLVLLDDHGLFRTSLARSLAAEPGLEVAGECGTSAEALQIVITSEVDLVLMDFDADSGCGSEFISGARDAGYRGHFLIVTGEVDGRTAAIVLKLGASGIFLKSDPFERLLQAIRLTAKGEVWVDPKVIQVLADQAIEPYPRPHEEGAAGVLEERERSVLLGILGGLTNKKIAESMGVSESAVKNIVQQLFGKAGVKTRSQLVRVALEGSLGAARDWGGRRAMRPEGEGQLVRESNG